MSRPVLVLFAFAVLSPGCIPVTEPVGDIDKAEPNKDLIGSWKDEEAKPRLWVVDRPEVKGNPKGLMRVRLFEKMMKLEDAKEVDTFWFFFATAGKHGFVNALVIDTKSGDPELTVFSKEGVYTQWTKHKNRGYYVAHLEMNGPVITVDCGNHRAFESLMKMNKFEEGGTLYQTPAGWLTKYLKENGPKDLFTKSKGTVTLTKVMEK